MRVRTVIRRVLAVVAVLVVAVTVAVAVWLRIPWIRTESVTFRRGDVELTGTVMLPRWVSPPYPAAVIVQGSGAVARWPYWISGKHLVDAGMAVLIYDKRGTGQSRATPAQSAKWTLEGVAQCGETFSTLADDALAGVALLKGRADIDGRRIGLAGQSQAGWIMPLAATRSPDVAFIVSTAGPAVSCGIEDRFSQLTGEYRAYPQFDAPAPYADGELADEEIFRQLAAYDGPQGYDPLPVLAQVKVPMLWVLGGRDRSVPTAWSVRNIDALIAAGAPFTVKLYPDGDHMLVQMRPGDLNFRMTLSGMLLRRIDYWADVVAWLKEKGVVTPSHSE